MKLELLDNKVFFENNGSKKEIHPFWLRERVNGEIFVDKNTHQIGMFDCSPQFYERGEDKVRKASEAYDLFYKTKDFDPKQYFISKTL